MVHRKFVVVLGAFVVVVLAAGVPASAKDVRTVNFDQAVSLKGTHLAAGSYKVSWAAHSPEASVTFTSVADNQVVATASARLVDRGSKYPRNSVVYDQSPDGSRTLVEIRFAGTKEALVFVEAPQTP